MIWVLRVFSLRRGLLLVAGMAVLAAAQGALAANYEFLAAPETDLNRVYRLDRATGEIGACQYGLKEASVDSGAKRNGFKRSGFERLCQAL